MRRIQAYDTEREAILLEYQLLVSNESTLHYAARIRESNRALRALEKRFRINEENSIEILLVYLNLCNMRMELSNQIDKHCRIQLATMHRAYVTLGGKLEMGVVQAMQQNIAEMQRTLSTNQENMSKVQAIIQQIEQRLKFLQKAD